MSASKSNNALVAKFGLDLTPLRNSARKAIEVVKGMAMKMKGSLSNLAKYMAPLAVAMGLVFSAGSVKNIFDMVDGMDELSRKTGVSIEGLLRMKGVFTDNGASVESLGMAVMQLNRAMSSKKGVDTFRELGFEVAQLRQMKPEVLFQAVGNAVGKIEDPMKRIGAATAVFGRMGRELIPVFSDPAFENLGTKQDKQAKIMAANAEALGAASDSFNHLLKVGRGFFVGIAVKVAPLWNAMAERLSKIDFVDAGLAFGSVLVSAAKLIAGYVVTLKVAAMAVYTAFAKGGFTLAATVQAVLGFLHKFKPALELAGYSIYLILLEAGKRLGQMVAGATLMMAKGLVEAFKIAGTWLDAIVAYFSGPFGGQVESVMKAIWDTFVAVAEMFGKALWKVIVALKDIWLGLASKFVVTIYDGMKAAASIFFAIVGKAVEKIINTLAKLPGMGHMAIKEQSVAERATEIHDKISGGLGGVDRGMTKMREFGDNSIAKGLNSFGEMGKGVSDKISPIFDAIKNAMSNVAKTTAERLKDAQEAAEKVWESLDKGDWADGEIAKAKSKIKGAFETLTKAGEEALGLTKKPEMANGEVDPTRGGYIGGNSIWKRGVKKGAGFTRKYGESKAAYEKRKAETKAGNKSGKSNKNPVDITNELLEKMNNTMEEAWGAS